MIYDLYDKPEYLAELAKRFAGCGKGDRILLMTMGFEPDVPEIAKLLDALEEAARAGSTIHFAVDARCFLDNNRRADPSPFRFNKFGPLWFHNQLPDKLQFPYSERHSALRRFEPYSNARAVIVNKPSHRFSVTFAGRSHIKTAIINDYAFVGGCNLDDAGNIDMMIGWQDSGSVGELYETLRAGIENGTIRDGLDGKDKTIRIDDNSSVLIDAGERGQSVIFESALSLIDRAGDWLVTTSQFFPNGVTGSHLASARKREVNLKIYSTNWRKFGLTGRVVEFTSRSIERLRLPADMFDGELPLEMPYLHAKLIASDKGMIIGSHNYVKAGTTFGTAEIALQSSDIKLAIKAHKKLEDQISN